MTRPATVAGKDIVEFNAPHYHTAPVVLDETAVTIASGVAAITGPRHTLTGEGGLADDVTSFSGMIDGQECWLRATSDSVTITIKHGASIQCASGADIALAEDDDLVKVMMVGSVAVVASSKQLAVGVADASIVLRLSQEESARASADLSLSTAVSTTASANLSTALSADVSLSTVVSAEASSRLSGDVSLSTLVSAEASSRLSGDVSLSTLISTPLSAEASSRLSGDTSLSVLVSVAESSRLSGDVSLSTLISAEASSRVVGDDSLSTTLSAEVSNRLSGDTSLSTLVSAEASLRLSGDTSLSTLISAPLSTLTSADTSIVARFSAADDSVTANIGTNIWKPEITAGAEGAEAANAIRITGQVKDLLGNNAASAQQIMIRSLAVTSNEGDLAVSATPVGTVKEAFNPATGENVMWMETSAAGAFAFIVTNTAAEETIVEVTCHGGIAQFLKLTFA